MRKITLLCLCYFASFFSTQAQSNTSDIFNESQGITFLGIDYSKSQFVGPASGWGSETTKSPTEMRDTYFAMWNNLIEKEPQNFKFAEATGRKTVTLQCNAVSAVNEKAKVDNLFVENSSEIREINEKDIAGMVKKYNLKKGTGIGMVFICEQMNKTLEQAVYWVTFVDMGTGKMLLTKKVIGKAGGFGFKNYWAGSIKSVIKTMKKDFKHWD